MTDLYGGPPRPRPSGVGTDFTETVPVMRPGSHLWNVLVTVAYLVFAPILVPFAVACLTNRVEWP